MAKKERAKIILLHAFHISYVTPEIPGQLITESMAVIEERGKRKLKDICFEIIEDKKVNCEYLCKHGFAVDVIIETASLLNIDLIVMGTKGASGLTEILIGSNTASVIEKSKCPVIAVPEKARYKGIKNITYATDYHASDIDALKKVTEIARLFKAQVTILHASDEEFNKFSEKEFLKSFQAKTEKKISYPKTAYKLLTGKNLEKVLEGHIKEEKPDLLVMSTHYRNLFDRILGSSATKRMVFHTKVPLLAFHHKKESVIFI